MRLIKYLIFGIILVFSVSGYAEFYKYTDETGNTRFTDDLSKVPEKQREKIRKYGAQEKPPVSQEEQPAQKSEESPQVKEEAADAGASDIAQVPESSDNKSDVSELMESRKSLEKRKQELEQTYQALMKEQSELLRAKGATTSQAKAQEHNEKLAKINDKILEYQKKLKGLDSDIATYNKKVEEQKKQTPLPSEPEKKD